MDRTENPFLNTLRIPVKNSRIIVNVAIVFHVISSLLPWLTGFGFVQKLLLSCLPFISLWFYLNKHLFCRSRVSVTELILNAEDSWQVKYKDGTVYPATLGKSMFVHPLLTIISLKYDERFQHYLFTPDVIDADQFRRLRVRLRFPQANE